ncbi:Carnitine O-palmitoyltransferase 2, mitochondrial [Halotydeus destructor]|nr:Carnitine O-palmitoyltransferase 2, mitochondrial [Halotydeus destructor]
MSLNKLLICPSVICSKSGSKLTAQYSVRRLSDYQYLERSFLPTYRFQRSLPKLGIPYVKRSIERYLAALQPIISDEKQYQNTVKIANEFVNSPDAKRLQEKLIAEDKANKNSSYISKPWFDMYLASRTPLVLNYNPFLAWKDDPDEQFNSLPIRATNMLISAMRFRRSLAEQVLKPEIFFMLSNTSKSNMYKALVKYSPEAIVSYVSMLMQGYPLDMSQYKSLFQSTRIPRKDMDELRSYPDSKHIAVLKSGQFYKFDILDSNGDLKDPQSIFAFLNYFESLKVDSAQDSVAVFSTEDRNTWASIRERLTKSTENANSLEMIDSAQFVVCLDDLQFDQASELIGQAHNFLHGNSAKQSSKPCNRWFDKSFSMMFDQAGHAGVSFEHSWGDGVAVLRMFNDVYTDSCENHFVGPDTKANNQVNPASEVQHLKFVFDDQLKSAHKEAESKWRHATEQLEFNYTKYRQMDRNYFKASKLSPDSMFQLGFQMAFHKVYKSFVPTYESCSTAAFKHGRTEVVRPCTLETKETCEAFSRPNLYSSKELRLLLDLCSKKHATLTREAAMGQGFDRHLFALRLQAEKEGQLPELYRDPSYSSSNHFVLSTSTLYGDYFSGGGFAPVVQDGVGLGYGYVDEQLGMLCSSFKGQRNGKQITEAFAESLNQIRQVIQETNPKAK